MGWIMVILLVTVQTVTNAQVLPFFGNGTCVGVDCGMGRCVASSAGNGTLLGAVAGHECQCDSGWSPILVDDRLRFLPCVVPDCTLNYTCIHDSTLATTLPVHAELSPFDPCFWSYCGSGECIKASSGFAHSCQCDEGFTNILSISILPCSRNCVVGVDCPNLGFTLSNGSVPPSTPLISNGGASSSGLMNLMWSLILTTSLILALRGF